VAAPAPPPPPPPPAPRQYAANPALEDIHFDFDQATIRRGDARILDASAAWLRANPTQLVLIEGHCDERGTNEYNLALGERRARAAMSYLVSKGVDASRISMVSYGKERPVCTQKAEACWARNRRAHFLVKPR
jgi:peptidoglycan-associated lipoprotein